jgi:hypothetical protein
MLLLLVSRALELLDEGAEDGSTLGGLGLLLSLLLLSGRSSGLFGLWLLSGLRKLSVDWWDDRSSSGRSFSTSVSCQLHKN